MSTATLPDRPDYVFCTEELPEDEVYRVAIAMDGLDAVIPTVTIAVTLDSALDICDRLNRRLGHDRASWTAFVANLQRAATTH